MAKRMMVHIKDRPFPQTVYLYDDPLGVTRPELNVCETLEQVTLDPDLRAGEKFQVAVYELKEVKVYIKEVEYRLADLPKGE